MLRNLLILAAVLLTLPGKITQGQTISPAPGSFLTKVILDQPYGQFTKIGFTGQNLQTLPPGDTFYTNASQLWLTDVNGYGSLHTFDYSQAPLSWIAIRPTYGPEGDFQEFYYEYAKGTTRWEVGPVNLPYGLANVSGVPEPASLAVGLLGVVGFLLLKRA